VSPPTHKPSGEAHHPKRCKESASRNIEMESSLELGDTALAADQDPFPREETKMEEPYNESGEEEVDSTPRPHTLSEKRRAENAAFDLWIEQNRSALSKGSRSLPGEVEQSAHALLRDFENKKIITNPRDYQLELFERAKRQNSIAVLDTGWSRILFRYDPALTCVCYRVWQDSYRRPAPTMDY